MFSKKIVRLPLHLNLSKQDLIYIKTKSNIFFSKYL